MKYAVVIKALDVFPKVVEFPDDADLLQECKKQLDCDSIEHVPADILRKGFLLFCDEEGHFKRGNLINPLASHLYGVMEHGQAIVGNAIILKEIPEDMDFMSKEEAESLAQEYTPVAEKAQSAVPFKLMEDIFEGQSV